MNKSSKLYRSVYEFFERPWVFSLNQRILGAGKRRQAKNFLRGVEFKSVVDIGCGPGEYAELACGPYLGIDTSASFIETCKKRYGHDPLKQFILADATTVQVAECYDLALLNSVLHHLNDDEVTKLIAWVAGSARCLFVLDLYPIPWNPLSRWLYAMDRGDYVREPAEQKALILKHPAMRLVKEGDAFCPNGVYRHTLFLFESIAVAGH